MGKIIYWVSNFEQWAGGIYWVGHPVNLLFTSLLCDTNGRIPLKPLFNISGIVTVFPGGRAAHTEDQIEEENEENLKKNGRK